MSVERLEPRVTYRITNVQSGLALELSEDDDKAIVAGELSSVAPRQLWIPEWTGDGQWTLTSAQNRRFIGFEGNPSQGVDLITSDNPKAWDIQQVGQVKYKITLPNSPLVVDSPFPAPGAPVQLFVNRGSHSQIWSFTPIFE